ncbi:hypothetical protein CHS0354_019556, partial [Potamilus streckersoni]
MICKLQLYLILLIQPCCIQAEEEIVGKTNSGEENPFFREHGGAISPVDNTFTAGNTRCKQGSSCEYYSSGKYSFCYTDTNWDYCCSGPCEPISSRTFMYCQSGELTKHCGGAGSLTVLGETCIPSHQCGVHESDGSFINTYWCKTDETIRWGYCCNPLDPCRDKND